MKRYFRIATFVLTIAILLTACGNEARTNNSAQEINTEGKTPAINTNGQIINSASTEVLNNMLIPPHSIEYKRLPDVNSQNIQEVTLAKKFFPNNRVIFAAGSDGFYTGSMAVSAKISIDSRIPNSPVITKLDNNGEVIWEKIYKHSIYDGDITNICVYPDDSFVFAVQAIPTYENNKTKNQSSAIIKCDKSGNIQWKYEFEDYSGDMLRNLFLTDSGNILAVGQWRDADSIDDIVITKLNKQGKVIDQKSFGGKDFDHYYHAKYDKGLGIVISGLSQSTDGDFAVSKNGSGTSFIACIDENLKVSWKYTALYNEVFSFHPFVISDGYIYKLGHLQQGEDRESSALLMKFDSSGKKLWSKDISTTGMYPETLELLANGNVVISCTNLETGLLIILDENGNINVDTIDLPFPARSIKATEDGGFVSIGFRNKKVLPAPVYISSIWFDTETVAARFGRNYLQFWRKTYDNHKDSIEYDQIEALSDGRLIILK